MTYAYLMKIDRNAFAKVYAADDMPEGGMAGVASTPFDTAEEAFADAVKKRDSGRYALVRVWVEGSNFVEFPQIDELLDYWRKNP